MMLFIRNEREKKIMKQRSLNLLLITVILTLCALFSGCTYSNSETNDNKNSVSQPTTIARKSYTEEEFVSLYKHNKFPKSYLMKIGDGNYFSFQHYDDNNNINIVTATFKKATKYTNISKLDKKNFSNYAEDIAPYVDKKGNLKTYKRTTKKIINGGLDEKLISVNNKAQRELVIVDVELKNKSNIKVDSTLTLQLSFNRYKSLDDELEKEKMQRYREDAEYKSSQRAAEKSQTDANKTDKQPDKEQEEYRKYYDYMYGHYGTKSFYNKFDDVRRVNGEPPFAPPHDEPHEPHEPHGPRR